MVKYAKEHDCDILCFGHTHVACDKVVDGVHLLNPGSLYMSRDGRGRSYMRLFIDEQEVRVECVFLDE